MIHPSPGRFDADAPIRFGRHGITIAGTFAGVLKDCRSPREKRSSRPPILPTFTAIIGLHTHPRTTYVNSRARTATEAKKDIRKGIARMIRQIHRTHELTDGPCTFEPCLTCIETGLYRGKS